MENENNIQAPVAPEKIEKKEPEIATVKLRFYKSKFGKIKAYQLTEKSTIHCANGQKLYGKEGDYFVELDRIQEFILPEKIFKKMFIEKSHCKRIVN